MSLTDDVLLQSGDENAAGYIYDERDVGATNTFVQKVCAGKLGGIPYTHEGIMFSNLAYELAADALLHDGPGQVWRLNLDDVCSVIATKGLESEDIIHTMGTVLVAGLTLARSCQPTASHLSSPMRKYPLTLKLDYELTVHHILIHIYKTRPSYTYGGRALYQKIGIMFHYPTTFMFPISFFQAVLLLYTQQSLLRLGHVRAHVGSEVVHLA